MAEPERTDQEWALQRRLEDVFSKLGEKFGDLTGRVETKMRSTVTFDEVGGLRQAKTGLKGFALALSNPDLYRSWGIDPPKGVLLYGPPGTGKSKLAQAVATASSAIFYHLKLMNLTSKFGANTGDLLQEILRIAMAEGPAATGSAPPPGSSSSPRPRGPTPSTPRSSRRGGSIISSRSRCPIRPPSRRSWSWCAPGPRRRPAARSSRGSTTTRSCR